MPPPGPAGSGAPTGFPDGAAQDPGQIGPPPSGPGDVPPPPSARPDPYGAFFAASPSNSASVLPSIGPETLAGSVWSGTPDRWAFLAERGLPASTMLIFRESDLLVVSANQTLSFRVDHRPTALQCRSLWPCISIIDENGVAHTVHYEALAAANAADPAALFVLDCITREHIEGGGDFPTEEALRENGGLLQRHRTADILCLRRLNDVGLLQVRVSSESGTTP
jgi:hypothetical protein